MELCVTQGSLQELTPWILAFLQISALYCKLAVMLLPILLWLVGFLVHPIAKHVLWAAISIAVFSLDSALVFRASIMASVIRRLDGTFASLLLAPQVSVIIFVETGSIGLNSPVKILMSLYRHLQAMDIHLEMQRERQGSGFDSYGWPASNAGSTVLGGGSEEVAGGRQLDDQISDPVGQIVFPLPPLPQRRRLQRGEAWR